MRKHEKSMRKHGPRDHTEGEGDLSSTRQQEDGDQARRLELLPWSGCVS